MISCPKCGFENTENANFCSHCGTRLAVSHVADVTAILDIVENRVSDVDDTQEGQPLLVPYPILVIHSGGGREGEEIVLEGDVVTIGRNPENDIFLDDITVSRRHARLVRDATGYTIEDLNSLNGTYVNRRRIERQHLSHGDEVQVGKFRLGYLGPEAR